jgi:two-component system response regulator GlrR
METLLHQIDRLAETDNLLLFRGAAGTGKSLLTRAAHNRSHRKEGPYVHISSKSLPEKLLKLEIFGRIGSGPLESPEHLGLLREARNGTFVLNDFESATPAFLQKVLYALINQKVRPVDAQSSVDIDVRAMATTLNSDGYLLNDQLAWELSEQLGVTAFKVPAINERREDIPLIANATIEMMEDKVDLQFSNKAMEALTTANWQGNVRQLSNTVRQIARLSTNKIISESLVNSRLNKSTYEIQPLSSAHLDFERKYLTDTLKATNGNVTKASLIAERNRTEFHRLLKKHKIEACLFRH